MVTAGIDVGYDATKVVIDAGTLKKYSLPSLVGAGAPKTLSYEKENTVKIKTVSLNGSVYTIGEDAIRYRLPLLTVRARNAIESIAYRALIKYTLGDIGKDMLVVTGLPVEYYFQGDREVVARVIMETVPEIKYLKVVPQPAGTFFDYVLDVNGSIRSFANDVARLTIGIIDIGRYTTDFTVFDRMDFIANLSGSINMGVEHILRAVADELNEKYGLRGMNTEDIKKAISKGYISLPGNKVDIQPVVEKHINKTLKDIESYIRSYWGTERIERIILTGGGAYLMRDISILELKPLVVQNPVIANATGFWKLARKLATSMAPVG
jgi:PRTRC genetic system protein D